MSFHIDSTFAPNIGLFNKKRDSDITFEVPHGKLRLYLHRAFLRPASKTVDEVVNGQINPRCTFNIKTKQLKWLFDNEETEEKYCRVLKKWMRFCYGENQSFEPDECPAALALLIQLKLCLGDNVQADLETFMIDFARNNVDAGTKMLCDCVLHYDECHDDDTSRIDKRLTEVVLTADNIKNHYELVVDECLMSLPSKYLDVVKYGEESDELSEFEIRRRYVRFHQDALAENEQKEIMKNCNPARPSSEELTMLYQQHVFNEEEMVNRCLEALKSKESQLISQEKIVKTTGGPNNGEGYPFLWMNVGFFLTGFIVSSLGFWFRSMKWFDSDVFVFSCIGMVGVLYAVFSKQMRLVIPTFAYILAFVLAALSWAD